MSQATPHEKAIEGKLFTVFKLPPLKSQAVLLSVLKMVAPAMGAAAKGVKDIDADVALTEIDFDPGVVAGGLGALLASLDPVALETLCNTMAEASLVDGKKLSVHFDLTFQDDLTIMYRWLWYAMGVQWGNFFDWLPGGREGVLGRLATVADSLSTSGNAG